MFSRKVKIELSPEADAIFKTLENDVLALTELVTELVKTHRELVAQFNGDVRVTLEEQEGIQVFETSEKPKRRGRSSPTLKAKEKVPLPPQLATPDATLPSVGGHPKQTPFSRAPRQVQVMWLLDVLKAEQGWVAPATIAKAYMTDERHNRYLRGIISRRLGEMYEDRTEGLERRDSQAKGSAFEYRLV